MLQSFFVVVAKLWYEEENKKGPGPFPASSQAPRLRQDISGWALICTLAKVPLPGEGPKSAGTVLASHAPAALPTEVWGWEADKERSSLLPSTSFRQPRALLVLRRG